MKYKVSAIPHLGSNTSILPSYGVVATDKNFKSVEKRWLKADLLLWLWTITPDSGSPKNQMGNC